MPLALEVHARVQFELTLPSPTYFEVPIMLPAYLGWINTKVI